MGEGRKNCYCDRVAGEMNNLAGDEWECTLFFSFVLSSSLLTSFLYSIFSLLQSIVSLLATLIVSFLPFFLVCFTSFFSFFYLQVGKQLWYKNRQRRDRRRRVVWQKISNKSKKYTFHKEKDIIVRLIQFGKLLFYQHRFGNRVLSVFIHVVTWHRLKKKEETRK